jgi:hypothetical protein
MTNGPMTNGGGASRRHYSWRAREARQQQLGFGHWKLVIQLVIGHWILVIEG